MPPILINRAPWNALIDDSGQNLDGTPWTKAQIKAVLLDPIDVALADVDDGTTKDAAQDAILALITTGAWIPYTPTWNTSGAVQPAIGNGTLTGSYAVVGKTCHFFLRLIMGSTTTYGDAGIWYLSLPLPGIALNYGFAITPLNSAGSAQPAAAAVAYSTNQNVYGMTPTGGLIGPTVPFTWAANAQLLMRGTYQTS